jgi:hypothetical protein
MTFIKTLNNNRILENILFNTFNKNKLFKNNYIVQDFVFETGFRSYTMTKVRVKRCRECYAMQSSSVMLLVVE